MIVRIPQPNSLNFSLEAQAWETFFAYYVTGPSKTWFFLLPYYNQTHIPIHLRLTIDAVGLANFSHHSHSPAAIELAITRYITALRLTRKILQSPEERRTDTTILTTLLLDLFEKLTVGKPRPIKGWASHVNGALTLISMKGLDHFQGPDMVKMLVRVSTNTLISCVASESPVPQGLIQLRTYAGRFLNIEDPKWLLSDLMVEYAQLRSDLRYGTFTPEESRCMSSELDGKLAKLALNMPASWQYYQANDEGNTEQLFGRYDIYADRHITQTWNVLRLVRILLNEHIIEHTKAVSAIDPASTKVSRHINQIDQLRNEICASVPQYTDSCSLDTTSPSQKLDCYTLLFPLYVAGQSYAVTNEVRRWILDKLHFIGNQFNMPNSEMVAQTLESGQCVHPWDVYKLLGSYAFAA